MYDDKQFQQMQQKPMGAKKSKKNSQVQIIKKDQIVQQQFQKQDDSKSKSVSVANENKFEFNID
jgi:hypothetical protein